MTNSGAPGAPTPGANPQPENNNSKQRLLAIAAAVIVILLGINIFLLINNRQQAKAKTELTTQLDESDQLRAELEKEYYEALSELEEMRGSNEELNALIEQQKAELKASKDRIEGLLANKSQLDRARAEIRKLNQQVEGYVAEINQLRQENEMLAAENQELAAAKENLDSTLTAVRVMSAEEKARLVSEKTELEETRARLAKKVDVASVVKVSQVEITTYKEKNNGKLKENRKADKIAELEICFNTTANQVAEAGPEEFLIRIINPLGETMAVDGMGSGVFTNNTTNEQVRYTKSKEFDYNQEALKACTSWSSDQPFQEGEYIVEIYNKGYLAGSGNFSLK